MEKVIYTILGNKDSSLTKNSNMDSIKIKEDLVVFWQL